MAALNIRDYRRTESGEPHRVRRARILSAHPEIASLFGWDPWPKYRMAGVLAVQLGLAWLVTAAASPRFGTPEAAALVALTAYLLGAPLNHYGGVIIHEASHDLCAPTKVQNRLIAIFANLPKILPYAMTFRRYHMQHHIALGSLADDNDLPRDVERRCVGNGPARKLLWLVLYPIAGVFLRGFLRAPNRWEIIGACTQMVFNLALYHALGSTALAYLALSTFASASLHPVAGHFIHEHYLWDERQETYSYYGPLNRITLNMGYHVEHHDFVQVPGRNLPRLHGIAREYYEGLLSHDSWTRIFWTFVIDARLSHHSRFVRPRSALRRGEITTLPVEPSGRTPERRATTATSTDLP